MWKRAFPMLQDALDRARTPGLNVREIRIAGGTYRADQGANVTPGDRLATLHLLSGVDLKGGYRGAYAPGTGAVAQTSAGPDSDHRDTTAYETRLTGDLLGDDGPPPGYANYGENTINILTIADARATLDGLTISNSGLDYNATPESAAIICEQSRLTLRDCRFLFNKGTYRGGGLNAEYSQVEVQCLFDRNFASMGAAIEVAHSTLIISNTRFTHNRASPHVGASLYASDSDVRAARCNFMGNSSETDAGGIYIDGYGSLDVRDCSFTNNAVTEYAAAVSCGQFTPSRFVHCEFRNNLSGQRGGAVFAQGPADFINCNFVENTSWSQGGGALAGAGTSSIARLSTTSRATRRAARPCGCNGIRRSPIAFSTATTPREWAAA